MYRILIWPPLHPLQLFPDLYAVYPHSPAYFAVFLQRYPQIPHLFSPDVDVL